MGNEVESLLIETAEACRFAWRQKLSKELILDEQNTSSVFSKRLVYFQKFPEGLV